MFFKGKTLTQSVFKLRSKLLLINSNSFSEVKKSTNRSEIIIIRIFIIVEVKIFNYK